MRVLALALAGALLVANTAGAQDSASASAPPAAAVDPESCRRAPGRPAVASVEHAGKTYELTSAACRELFLSDPERYAQLFDAFAEMERAGAKPRPRGVSLVPS